MKLKHLSLLATIIILLIWNPLNAQTLKISAFGQEGIVMGDITKKDINNNSAGYVDFASSGGLEVNFYLKNNLGFGIRWIASTYGIDTDTYEKDLIKKLGINNTNYDLDQAYSFVSFGSDLGISYMVKFNEKLNLEPYVYFGFRGLVSPNSSVIYSQNGTTYQYKSKSQIFFGLNYSPGVKFNWNAFKHLGFYCSVEYAGNAYLEDDVRSLKYSANTLDITDTEKKYNTNSLNFGIGVSFRLSKKTTK